MRDSGLVHAPLGLGDLESLLGHPIVGARWEGFVIENLIAATPEGSEATFSRTAAGVGIALPFALPGGRLWAIGVKRSLTPQDG